MKKILVTIIILVLAGSKVNAQGGSLPSLKETTDWLREKFTKYTYNIFDGDCGDCMTTHFNILAVGVEKGNLEFYYTYHYTEAGVNHDGNIFATIPIADIDRFDDGIYCKLKSIKISQKDKWQRGYDEGEQSYDFVAYEFKIWLDVGREEDLQNRVKKAIDNLKYYYPKAKNSEAF